MTYIILSVLGILDIILFKIKKRDFPYLEAASAVICSTLNSLIFRIIFQGAMYSFYLNVYRASYFKIKLNNILIYILIFLIVDFFFYWIHRFCHEWRFCWTAHEVHHYPNKLTILGATSQSLVGLILNVHLPFFVFLAFIGIHPKIFLSCYGINLLYQLWLHNEHIPSLGFIEKFINTPHLHRIHHSLSKSLIGKNYGGVLVIFDRLFDTYYSHSSELDNVYGTIPPLIAKSFFSIWKKEAFSWLKFFSGFKKNQTLFMKVRYFFVID